MKRKPDPFGIGRRLNRPTITVKCGKCGQEHELPGFTDEVQCRCGKVTRR